MGTSVNQALRKAQTHARKGEVEDARRLYSEILRSYPKNARARMALAALGADQARDETTVLLALYTAGKFSQAAARAVELLDQTPKSPVLWNILGAALGQLNDHDGALRAFEQSCIVAPTHPDGFSNLGNTLKRLERFEEAVTSYARATALGENTAALHCSQGVAYTALAQHARALGAFKKAVALEQTSARAQFGIGIASAALGDLDGALEAYETAAKLSPADLAVHTNIGNLRHQMGQQHAALAAYQKALLIAPANALVQYNVGKAYFALGQWQNAIDAFVIARAQDPLNERIHNSLGTAYQQIGRRTDAMDSYQQALSHDPDMANAHANIGVLHQEEGRRAEAINAFSRALALQPDFPLAEAQMLHQRQHLCDWSQTDHLKDACTRLGITTAAVPSFTMLASEDNPAHQLARSRRWAAEMFRITPKPLPASPAARPERLRIGYFSADFRNHPVLHLISGLLRSHDRKTFDVLAFGYGKQSDGALANQMKMDVDQFFDASPLTDAALADLAREEALDIAIDLTGYTQDTRSGVFQHRLAGVQINFLGYPASMGADFIDYLIADPTVIPQAQRGHYDERIIYLPQCFQPNDDMREIAQNTTTRADFNLPDSAVVLCCFNNLFKISPDEFDIWMRVLEDVKGSVLWLAQPGAQAGANLRAEAQARGVDPDRLIFASRLPVYAEHLARLRHADLFLDTFNYNAHTTASDALWAGLPVVTKCGAQFAARVAASVLKAVGLPEMVTQTAQEYEALIRALAQDPTRLRDIRHKLETERAATPLFDTRRYTRNFEAGLNQAHDLYVKGKPPADIWVREDTNPVETPR